MGPWATIGFITVLPVWRQSKSRGSLASAFSFAGLAGRLVDGVEPPGPQADAPGTPVDWRAILIPGRQQRQYSYETSSLQVGGERRS